MGGSIGGVRRNDNSPVDSISARQSYSYMGVRFVQFNVVLRVSCYDMTVYAGFSSPASLAGASDMTST